MSVIAWDGKVLAADRQSTRLDSGDVRIQRKVWRHESDAGVVLYAATGGVQYALRILDWHRTGATPESWPKRLDSEDGATLIVITAQGVTEFDGSPVPLSVDELNLPMAWGIGGQSARAAMLVGLDARQAVELTCEINAYCGCGIDTVSLET